MRKYRAFTTICLLILVFLSVSAYAITLNCWHSDSSNGCFMTGGAKVKLMDYNSFSASAIDGYIDYALGKWNSAGIPAQQVTSNHNIALYCGDLNFLQCHYTDYQSNWRGLTSLNGSYSTTVTYNGVSHNIYDNSSTNTTYLLYRSSLSASNYKNTLLHEFGHSLGWYDGHSPTSGDIMYATAGSGTSLKTRDKNQALQMYN